MDPSLLHHTLHLIALEHFVAHKDHDNKLAVGLENSLKTTLYANFEALTKVFVTVGHILIYSSLHYGEVVISSKIIRVPLTPHSPLSSFAMYPCPVFIYSTIIHIPRVPS